MKDELLQKVHGFMFLPITQERIELRTLSDIKYAKYRLSRLQFEYPEKFEIKQNGEM